MSFPTSNKFTDYWALGFAGKSSIYSEKEIHCILRKCVIFSMQVIHLASQQNECVVDIGSSQLINYLLYVLRSANSSSVGLCLDTIYTLLSHTPVVKEALAKGGNDFYLYFCY